MPIPNREKTDVNYAKGWFEGREETFTSLDTMVTALQDAHAEAGAASKVLAFGTVRELIEFMRETNRQMKSEFIS